VNLRPRRGEHRIVNNVLTRAGRSDFTVTGAGWNEIEGIRLKTEWSTCSAKSEKEKNIAERKMRAGGENGQQCRERLSVV
jgi:hypothetical protein